MNLDPSYVKRLESTPTHQASLQIKAIRNARPSPEDLPLISLAELANHREENDTWVSVLGYVINVGTIKWLKIHRGRDITTRALMAYHDIPLDLNDDR